MGFCVSPREHRLKSHLPVAIVIDRSGSTGDIRGILNKYSGELIQSLKGSLFLKNIVELLVIQYSSDYKTVVDFKPLEQVGDHDLDIPSSHGFTATGRALLHALQRLDEKKTEWKLEGEKYYQPLLFLLTDGYPDAGRNAPPEVAAAVQQTYAEAAQQIRRRELDQKLTFIGVGIEQKNGIKADLGRLRELSNYPDRVLCVKDLENGTSGVEQFFDLVYQSTNAVFEDTPIDDVVIEFLNA